MNRLKMIVAGVDFSPASKVALQQAARMARWNDAALHVVHVLLPHVATELAESVGVSEEELRRHAQRGAAKDLEQFVGGVEAPKGTKTEVLVGPPVQTLIDHAASVNADLLVMGVTGAGAQGAGAGSIATACVHHAKTKVLLVHEAQTTAFETVVACLDFSATSRLAIEHAAHVARHDHSRLRVLHVYHGPWNVLHYRSESWEATPAFRTQYVARLQGLANDALAAAGGDLAGLDAEAVLVDHQSYGRAIVDYVRTLPTDLVVLGTAGHRTIRYFFAGSTAERVLREAPCSVLTIPPAATEA